jgi:hypothetical protein
MKTLTIGTGKAQHAIAEGLGFLSPLCGGVRISGFAQTMRVREHGEVTCKACMKRMDAAPKSFAVGDTYTDNGVEWGVIAVYPDHMIVNHPSGRVGQTVWF